MIRITQIKLTIKHTDEDIKAAAAKALKIQPSKIKEFSIIKKSIDARKYEIKYIYTIDVMLNTEQ